MIMARIKWEWNRKSIGMAALSALICIGLTGCGSETSETWDESYHLSDRVVWEFGNDGSLNIIESGYYKLEEKDGKGYLYLSDTKNAYGAIPYVIEKTEDEYSLQPEAIEGQEDFQSGEETAWKLIFEEGTDGLSQEAAVFDGVYLDAEYKIMRMEFVSDGTYTSTVTQTYSVDSEDTLTWKGPLGTQTYTYEKDDQAGTLRLIYGDTFDITLEKQDD